MSKKTGIKTCAPFRCGHCSNVAPMEIVAEYSNKQMQIDEENSVSWETSTNYELLLCPSCDKLTLRSYYWDESMDSEDEVAYRLLYPHKNTIPQGLPDSIGKAYEAAIKVKSIDSNAFGVLIGRVIEMVCVDREAKGRYLGQKLGDLANRKEIPEKLVSVAKNLTEFRNVGAHAELGELTQAQVPIVNALCRAILDYVYTAPYLAQKAEDSLNALKKINNANKGNIEDKSTRHS